MNYRPPEPAPSSLTLARALERHLEAMRTRGFAEATLENRQRYVGAFVRWAEMRGVRLSSEVTREMIERYRRHLFLWRKEGGEPLAFRSQAMALVNVRELFRWLVKERLLVWNPAADLELPRAEHRLPRHVLTAPEAESVLTRPDLESPLGLRDRAILEVLYSTGIRRAELLALKVYDLDAERGTVMVRQGKGKKDRVVPVGERALAWVGKYLCDVRPHLVRGEDDGTLFLSSRGRPISKVRVTEIARMAVRGAELGKKGACHLFRHTMATVMLENGADVRFVQEMLGHAKLDTTQIYTHVSITKLKEVHGATHPAAKMPARTAGRDDDGDGLPFLAAEAAARGDDEDST